MVHRITIVWWWIAFLSVISVPESWQFGDRTAAWWCWTLSCRKTPAEIWKRDWCTMTLRCSRWIKVQVYAEIALWVHLSIFSYYIPVVSIPYHTTEPSAKRVEFFFRGCNKFLIYRLTVAEIMQYLKYLLPGERSCGGILADRSWTSLGLRNVIYGDAMSNTIITKAKTVAW